jgi:nitrite reductase (NADH) small subunit
MPLRPALSKMHQSALLWLRASDFPSSFSRPIHGKSEHVARMPMNSGPCTMPCRWQQSDTMQKTWMNIGHFESIPRQAARRVRTANVDIAIFRTINDEFYALEDKCPHKGGPLSQGIVHGAAVSCPLHNWSISLATGEAMGADKGCTPRIALKRDGTDIYLELDAPDVAVVV